MRILYILCTIAVLLILLFAIFGQFLWLGVCVIVGIGSAGFGIYIAGLFMTMAAIPTNDDWAILVCIELVLLLMTAFSWNGFWYLLGE